MEKDQYSGDRKSLFGAHVSNIPCYVTIDQLKQLFSSAGNVVEVYLPPRVRSDSKFTFAFVRYVTEKEVLNSIKLLNNVKIGNSKLEVSLSLRTKELMNQRPGKSLKSSSSCGSIVRKSMPRLERNRFTVLASDERHIHQKLKSCLNYLNVDPKYSQLLGFRDTEDVKAFMSDVKDVFVKISNVPFGVGLDTINFKGESITKSNLEDIILQYHESSDKRNPFKDIDFDISGNSLLSEREQVKMFPFLSEI